MKTFSKVPSSSENSELIACPLCGQRDFKPRWSIESSRWVECRRCSLLMQNPQPVSDDILDRYDGEYFQYEQENEENFLNLMKLGLKDIGFDELGREMDGPGSFLDIGCATGALAGSLRKKGWEAEGVEVCRAAADFGSRKWEVPIFPGTVEEACFPDGRFDFVHNSHVIEHINDPAAFAAEIFRILKPGGYYICATPNSLGLQAVLFQEKWRSAIPDHLFLFSLKTLSLLAEKAGFRVLNRKTWGGLGKGCAPGWLKSIADPLVKPLNWGDVMIYLFQKPRSCGNPEKD